MSHLYFYKLLFRSSSPSALIGDLVVSSIQVATGFPIKALGNDGALKLEGQQ